MIDNDKMEKYVVDDRVMTFTLVIPVEVEKITARNIDLEHYLKTQAALQMRQLLKGRRTHENCNRYR